MTHFRVTWLIFEIADIFVWHYSFKCGHDSFSRDMTHIWNSRCFVDELWNLCAATRCGILQCVEVKTTAAAQTLSMGCGNCVFSSVLQYVAACCNALQYVAMRLWQQQQRLCWWAVVVLSVAGCCRVLPRVVASCSVLQRVVVKPLVQQRLC